MCGCGRGASFRVAGGRGTPLVQQQPFDGYGYGYAPLVSAQRRMSMVFSSGVGLSGFGVGARLGVLSCVCLGSEVASVQHDGQS